MVAGKVVFITGTGRGQGRAAALAFCAEGAHVVGGDIDAAAAVQTARLAGAGGGGSVLDAGPLDVTDEESVRAWIGATRQLAAEGAAHGIRVNAISPGMIDTEGGQELIADPAHPMHRIAASVPLGRLGTPADVVNVALFLASDKAAYVTGANIVVDGGWSAVLPGPAA
ncbi:MAG TPA: SDR family oxidoreductase [Streptosporangiaceae bacterium]